MAIGCDCEAAHGFGFQISPEELRRVWGSNRTINELVDGFRDSLGITGDRPLPNGFKWVFCGSFYASDCLGCIISTSQNLSEILRGDIPCPDFQPLLEWAKKHNIQFENDKPELFVEMLF